MRIDLLLPAVFLIAACSTEAPPPSPAPQPEAATSKLPAAGTADAKGLIASRMKNHFIKGFEAKDAVVRGDLDGARAAAKWLAESTDPVEGMGERWDVRIGEMRAVSLSISQASDVPTAAAGVADLAATCGSCHLDLGKGPTYGVGEPPPVGEGVKAHMARHQWAADRFWEGLTGPNEEAWLKASEVMKDDALVAHSEDEGVAGTVTVASQPHAEQVHRIGASAAAAGSLAEKSEIYGELLATCAGCHAITGGGPKKGPSGEQ